MNLIQILFFNLFKKIFFQKNKNLLLSKKFINFTFYGLLLEFIRYLFFVYLDTIGVYYGYIIIINLFIFSFFKIMFQLKLTLKKKIDSTIILKFYLISAVFGLINYFFIKIVLIYFDYSASYIQAVYLVVVNFIYFIILKKNITFNN